MKNLRALNNGELLLGLESLVGSERQVLAQIITHLGEVEQRRLHLELAYSSMFDFCTRKLCMSEGAAFRRITAARLAQVFPVITELVATGAIHLSALVLLRDHLTKANHAELLSQASGKSKAQVQALLATQVPKPDAPSKIRKLPAPTAVWESPPQPMQPALGLDRPALGETQVTSSGADESTAQQSGSQDSTTRQSASPQPVNGQLEPLSPARYRVQFTAGQSLKDKLERAKNLLSHANPAGDLAVVVERALDLLLAELEKKRLGKSKRPRRSGTPKRGRVAQAARREVFAHDGEQCSFVGPDGRRCEAKAFLEIDHVKSRALGGSDEIENLRILCRAHNRLWAERTFGKEHVERSIRVRQRKQPKVRTRGPGSDGKVQDPDDRYVKLFQALTKLGFRRSETCAVLDKLRRGESAIAWAAPLDELLRTALQLLTK